MVLFLYNFEKNPNGPLAELKYKIKSIGWNIACNVEKKL